MIEWWLWWWWDLITDDAGSDDEKSSWKVSWTKTTRENPNNRMESGKLKWRTSSKGPWNLCIFWVPCDLELQTMTALILTQNIHFVRKWRIRRGAAARTLSRFCAGGDIAGMSDAALCTLRLLHQCAPLSCLAWLCLSSQWTCEIEGSQHMSQPTSPTTS